MSEISREEFEALHQQVADQANLIAEQAEQIAALRARLAGVDRDVSWLSYRAGRSQPALPPMRRLPVSPEIELERLRREQELREHGDRPEPPGQER
jgi:hypothetical protein